MWRNWHLAATIAVVAVLAAAQSACAGGEEGESRPGAGESSTSAPLVLDGTATIEDATDAFAQALALGDVPAIILLFSPQGLENAAGLQSFASRLPEISGTPFVEDYGEGENDRLIRFTAPTASGPMGFVTRWVLMEGGWRVDAVTVEDR